MKALLRKNVTLLLAVILVGTFSFFYQQAESERMAASCKGVVGLDRAGEKACFYK